MAPSVPVEWADYDHVPTKRSEKCPGKSNDSGMLPVSSSDDLTLWVPLLDESEVRGDRFKGQSEISGTALNLMNTMIGAGLMALPHVFAMCGLVWGVILTAIVSVFMYVCSSVLVRCADITGHRTYTELARDGLGWAAGFVIQWSIILNNGGVLLVYLIIIGDLLVGTEETGYNGLVSTVLNTHNGDKWYASRWFVVLVVAIIFIQPLIVQKRLHILARTSAFAIGLAAAFAALTTVLAVLAGVKGKLEPINWWPNPELTEPDITRNCVTAIYMTAVPVLLYSYVFLFNIPPLMAELKDYSKPRMLKAVKNSLLGTTALYVVVAISSSIVFGIKTQQDVLVNLYPGALENYMNPRLADVISTLLSVGYAFKLVLIFPLANWSLRENLSDLLFKTQRPKGWQFYAITYLILAVVYVLSQTVRGVLNAIDIIGCTACVGITFVVPAWLIAKFWSDNLKMKIFAIVVWVVGMFCLLEGIVGEVWREVFRVPLFC